MTPVVTGSTPRLPDQPPPEEVDHHGSISLVGKEARKYLTTFVTKITPPTDEAQAPLATFEIDTDLSDREASISPINASYISDNVFLSEEEEKINVIPPPAEFDEDKEGVKQDKVQEGTCPGKKVIQSIQGLIDMTTLPPLPSLPSIFGTKPDAVFKESDGIVGLQETRAVTSGVEFGEKMEKIDREMKPEPSKKKEFIVTKTKEEVQQEPDLPLQRPAPFELDVGILDPDHVILPPVIQASGEESILADEILPDVGGPDIFEHLGPTPGSLINSPRVSSTGITSLQQQQQRQLDQQREANFLDILDQEEPFLVDMTLEELEQLPNLDDEDVSKPLPVLEIKSLESANDSLEEVPEVSTILNQTAMEVISLPRVFERESSPAEQIENAVVKIQAGVRGYLTRKNLKQQLREQMDNDNDSGHPSDSASLHGMDLPGPSSSLNNQSPINVSPSESLPSLPSQQGSRSNSLNRGGNRERSPPSIPPQQVISHPLSKEEIERHEEEAASSKDDPMDLLEEPLSPTTPQDLSAKEERTRRKRDNRKKKKKH